MTEEVAPEILTATQALEKRITATELEVIQMKATISSKEALISGWRDIIKTLLPNAVPRKNRFFNLPSRPPASQTLARTGGDEAK